MTLTESRRRSLAWWSRAPRAAITSRWRGALKFTEARGARQLAGDRVWVWRMLKCKIPTHTHTHTLLFLVQRCHLGYGRKMSRFPTHSYARTHQQAGKARQHGARSFKARAAYSIFRHLINMNLCHQQFLRLPTSRRWQRAAPGLHTSVRPGNFFLITLPPPPRFGWKDERGWKKKRLLSSIFLGIFLTFLARLIPVTRLLLFQSGPLLLVFFFWQ